MKKYLVIAIIITIVVAGGFLLNFYLKHPQTDSLPLTHMEIKSSAFTHNQKIPSKYTCDGDNINPPLTFSNVPKEAKSLVLIVDDPDAPAGTWVHWLLWNLKPDTSGINENTVPAGSVSGTTSFGNFKYGGPCPPSGTHRYFFKLYALDATLSLEPRAAKQDLEQAMKNHILTQAELIGLYNRQ